MGFRTRTFIYFLVSSSFLTLNVSGQTNINNGLKLTPDTLAVKQFIEKHNFSYALAAWSTSNWFSISGSYYLLIKQKEKSYLMLIRSDYKGNIDMKSVKSRLLDNNETVSLMAALQPDASFSHTQAQLDSLDKGCMHIENGTVYSGTISDGGYFNLLEFSGTQFKTIRAYAPEFHLENCLQYQPAFGILKGLVNTYKKLEEAAVRLR